MGKTPRAWIGASMPSPVRPAQHSATSTSGSPACAVRAEMRSCRYPRASPSTSPKLCARAAAACLPTLRRGASKRSTHDMSRGNRASNCSTYGPDAWASPAPSALRRPLRATHRVCRGLASGPASPRGTPRSPGRARPCPSAAPGLPRELVKGPAQGRGGARPRRTIRLWRTRATTGSPPLSAMYQTSALPLKPQMRRRGAHKALHPRRVREQSRGLLVGRPARALVQVHGTHAKDGGESARWPEEPKKRVGRALNREVGSFRYAPLGEGKRRHGSSVRLPNLADGVVALRPVRTSAQAILAPGL